MDDIIIKKGTDVVLNRDLNVREVTVARKGLKVACEKDIKKGDTEVTLSYEGRMKFDVPVEYISKSDNTLFENKESKSAKNDIIDDKLRWDLLPMEEIEDIVRVYHAGAKKYGPNKWQNLDNGFERYRAAAARHLMEYMKGERIDSDTGAFHLAQCAWNCIAMLWYDKHGKGLIPLNKEEKK
jgi:hypothetical protein